MRRLFTALAAASSLIVCAPAWAGDFPSTAAEVADACVYGSTDTDVSNRAVPGCVTVSSPWIPLGALDTNGWTLSCPSNAIYAYVAAAGEWGGWGYTRTSHWIERPNYNDSFSLFYQQGANLQPSGPGKGDYWTTNWSASAVHWWHWTMGCSPEDDGQHSGGVIPHRVRAAAARRDRTFPVVREVALRSERRAVLRRSCPAGSRLLRARHAVGYHTTRRPALAAHRSRVASQTRTGATFEVTTGRLPGRVTAQTVLTCRTGTSPEPNDARERRK